MSASAFQPGSWEGTGHHLTGVYPDQADAVIGAVALELARLYNIYPELSTAFVVPPLSSPALTLTKYCTALHCTRSRRVFETCIGQFSLLLATVRSWC